MRDFAGKPGRTVLPYLFMINSGGIGQLSTSVDTEIVIGHKMLLTNICLKKILSEGFYGAYLEFISAFEHLEK